jgi:hypothetical protein
MSFNNETEFVDDYSHLIVVIFCVEALMVRIHENEMTWSHSLSA